MPASPSGLVATPSATVSSPKGADAFINFGTGPYPAAASLTSGGASAWYLSPVVDRVFGGVPNAQQQAQFTSQVVADVRQTFALSGLSPSVTADPTIAANHTLSIVSGTGYTPNSTAIGVSQVGGNGFSFVDRLAPAQSLNDLEWALAHNIAHEMMHTFGVAVHHDTSGAYLDSASASWKVLTDPTTVFSPAAVQDILAHDYGRGGVSDASGEELINDTAGVAAEPVPEPATLVLWAVLGIGAWVLRRRVPGLRLDGSRELRTIALAR